VNLIKLKVFEHGKLTGILVNPEQVSTVRPDFRNDCSLVTMHNGEAVIVKETMETLKQWLTMDLP
jgi:hypothetical protein